MNPKKERLKRKIKILESADKYTWLELDKSLFLSQKSIKVCAIYSQPSLSNYYRDSIWEDLETSIIGFSDETSFCIIGDMNGRTGTRPDFEENRNDKHVRCIPSNVTKKARKNCDETMNRVGEIILELIYKLPTAEQEAIYWEILLILTKIQDSQQWILH